MVKTLRLISKKVVEPKRVYDLEIQNNHNFIANNILVHNCYQEQYMKIAQQIGGFSAKEINKLRKDLTKGGKVYDTNPEVKKKINAHKKKFIEHAINYLGEEKSNEIWNLIFAFSAYGFNKSHSISYTYISYYEAWLKYYYMPEFYTALLNNTDCKKEKKGENLIAQYLIEAMKKGFRIHTPSVNYSDVEFTIKGDKNSQEKFDIIFGLAFIKGLAIDSINKIIKERENGEFSSIDNFFERLDVIKGKKINKRDIEALIWSGSFDCFLNEIYIDRFDLHEYIFETIKGDKKYIKIKKSDDTLIEKEHEYINISMVEIATYAIIKKEYSDRGVYINPLIEADDKGEYMCIGKIVKLENNVTKTGKDYIRINLRDETNELKMVYAWPWKCKNWDGLKYGQTIIAYINHDDSNFKNLTGWSLITDRSEALQEIEQKSKEEKAIEEKKQKNKQIELEKLAIKKIMEVVKKYKKLYTITIDKDNNFDRPNAIIKIDCGRNGFIEILVFYYNDKKGFSIKDLRILRNGYNYYNIINDTAQYIYKTKDFKSELLIAKKSKDGLRYPNFTTETLLEEVLFNTINNKV